MRYKLIVFDLDGTLVKEQTINHFAEKYGFTKRLNELRIKLSKKKIKEYFITRELARKFKGKTKKDIEKECKKFHLIKSAKSVIKILKKENYKIGIITQAFSPIAEYFAKKIKADYLVCPILTVKNKRFDGDVEIVKSGKKGCQRHGEFSCKGVILSELVKRENYNLNETIAIGNSTGDMCMLNIAGQGLLINPSKNLKDIKYYQIKNLKEIFHFLT